MTLHDIKTLLHDSAAKIAKSAAARPLERLVGALILFASAFVVIAWWALVAYGGLQLYRILFG